MIRYIKKIMIVPKPTRFEIMVEDGVENYCFFCTKEPSWSYILERWYGFIDGRIKKQ